LINKHNDPHHHFSSYAMRSREFCQIINQPELKSQFPTFKSLDKFKSWKKHWDRVCVDTEFQEIYPEYTKQRKDLQDSFVKQGDTRIFELYRVLTTDSHSFFTHEYQPVKDHCNYYKWIINK